MQARPGFVRGVRSKSPYFLSTNTQARSKDYFPPLLCSLDCIECDALTLINESFVFFCKTTKCFVKKAKLNKKPIRFVK